MCRHHDVTGQDGSHIDRPVFGITEEKGPDGNEWEISFKEGHPDVKADLVAPKTTQISVVRQTGDQADYSVRCYDIGFKIETQNKDREDYWRTRVEECLGR